MILTVSLNAALDRTYRVGTLLLDAAHRVEENHVQAGGKGVNVSRVLATFGVATVATGLVAGSNGKQIEHDLASSGIEAAMHVVGGESRQTVSVFSSGGDTWVEFDEAGPDVAPEDWNGFLETIEQLLDDAAIVVLSGSLPPGLPADAYRQLIERAHARGTTAVLDTSGSAMRAALEVGPDVVTPNRSELEQITGLGCASDADVVDACRALRKLGARSVVATLGGDGAIAIEGDNVWRITHPTRTGNPVGAGDAMAAGLASGMAAGDSFADGLVRAFSWALASLNRPWAGHVDPRDADQLREQVSVVALDGALGFPGMSDYFVLAFDHRNSFRHWLATLGVTPPEVAEIAPRLKGVALAALDEARTALSSDEVPMLLVDEEYGSGVIGRARSLGIATVVPVEKSGQAEFLFEHGDAYWERFMATGATAAKALVRYNAEGDADLNARGRERLVELTRSAERDGVHVMLELLVPATESQLASVGADADAYDERVRPKLVLQAIEEIVEAGIRPQWWKVEGYLDASTAAQVAQLGAQTSAAGCLVLGRGADARLVERWVATAAAAGGFAGFAVGRTLWTTPLRELLEGRITDEDAASRIAVSYLEIVDAYRQGLQDTAATETTAAKDTGEQRPSS